MFFWVFPRRQIVVGRLYTRPLKMELTQGSETSANYNLTPGKYPKEHIQYEATSANTLELLHIRCNISLQKITDG